MDDNVLEAAKRGDPIDLRRSTVQSPGVVRAIPLDELEQERQRGMNRAQRRAYDREVAKAAKKIARLPIRQ